MVAKTHHKIYQKVHPICIWVMYHGMFVFMSIHVLMLFVLMSVFEFSLVFMYFGSYVCLLLVHTMLLMVMQVMQQGGHPYRNPQPQQHCKALALQGDSVAA